MKLPDLRDVLHMVSKGDIDPVLAEIMLRKKTSGECREEIVRSVKKGHFRMFR